MINNRPLHQFIVNNEPYFAEDTLLKDIMENNIASVAVKLKQLTQEEIDVINKDKNFNYINNAAQSGHIEILKLLDEYGVNIHKTDGHSCNALHKVFILGHVDTIQYLIERGVDVNLKNIWGQTPLWQMVEMKHKESVLLMLKAGANVEDLRCLDQPLIIQIKELLGNEIQFTNINTKEHPIYRMLNDDGYPTKIVKERKKDEFKSHSKTNTCVAFSLFKNVPVVDQVLRDHQLAAYLNLNDIQNAAAVSAVRDNSGGVMNSLLLSEVDQEVNVHLSFRK